MKYKTGMIFGFFDQPSINGPTETFLKHAASLCDLLYIAVSSDEEAAGLNRKLNYNLSERIARVEHYLRTHTMRAEVLGKPETFPKDYVLDEKYRVEAYILSERNDKAFGQELREIIKEHKLPGKVLVVKDFKEQTA